MYNLIYQTQFDAINPAGITDIETYYVKIFKKDYTGVANNVTAAATPVNHQWLIDEPKPTIKGSSLMLNLINPGNLPLRSFFSTEDDTFKIELRWGSQLLFTGYLVQTDCTEVQVDTTHEISLSFTDNLGLLKNVPLNDAADLWGQFTEGNYNIQRLGGGWVIASGSISAEIGDVLIVTNYTPAWDGTYHITNVVQVGSLTFLTTSEQVFGPIGTTIFAHIKIITPVDLSLRLPLREFLRICLRSTNLDLNTTIYGNINPIGAGVSARMFEDVYLGAETFQTNGKFLSCYDVLTNIVGRFRATLMQSNGVWNIVRWDELRYFSSSIPAFNYDYQFIFLGESSPINTFTYWSGIDIETGLEESMIRPYKTVRETFDYKQPANLLKNGNLSLLGPLLNSYSGSNLTESATFYPSSGLNPNMINSFAVPPNMEVGELFTVTGSLNNDGVYTVMGYQSTHSVHVAENVISETADVNITYSGGAVFISEHDTPYWFNGAFAPFPNRFIRVETNTVLGIETARYLVLTGGSGDNSTAAKSNDIEINEGDRIKLSYTYRTRPGYTSIAGAAGGIRLTDGVTTRWVQDNNKWGAPAGASLSIVDSTEWETREFDSDPAPFSGIVNVFLPWFTPSNFDEEHFKDFSFKVTFGVADQINVIGQVHTQKQPPRINNEDERDLVIDDSPRNSINGTLFLETFTGLLQDKTFKWNRNGIAESQRLGSITTFEELLWRRTARSKLEGNLLNLIQLGNRFYIGEISFNQAGAQATVHFYNIPDDLIIVGSILNFSGPTPNTGVNYTVQSVSTVPGLTGFSFNLSGTVTGQSTTVMTVRIQNTKVHLSMMNVMEFQARAGKTYVAGNMSIKYRTQDVDGTFWEMYNSDDKDDEDFIRSYEFKYLYDNK